jgi:diguanylate cyclase (GGDEF)-like protein
MSDPSLLGLFHRAGTPPTARSAEDERPRAADLEPDPASTQRLLACLPGPDLARAMSALEQAAAEVVPASTWSEALGTMERLLPDVAVVHASFEEGSAIELCSALRRLPGGEEAAIVLVGASGRSVRRALDAGATDVMRAPVDWDLLGRRVATLLSASRLRADLRRCQSEAESSRQLAAQACAQVEAQKGLDPLTGLPTRRVLQGLIERALGRSRGPGSAVALMLLDLERFSEINETLGRDGGDEALKLVAERLSEYLRSGEPELPQRPGLLLRAAARLSGDEFAVVLTSVVDPATLSAFAEGMLAALSAPARVKGTEVFLSATIGITISSTGVDGSEALFQQAETALYDAKRRGGGNWRFYSPALEGATERKLGIDRMLRRAFERGEIRLHYQPVIDLRHQRITGAEALLRWPEPGVGWIPPAVFVPIAEETGLMMRIGDWVLHEACRQLRSWIDEGLPTLLMAVNVSRCQLERGGLLASVRSALAETGVPPERLELELSERGVLRGDTEVLLQLREIKALGVRLLVDDFGTGDSSISYLRQFPIDGIKVDRALIGGLGERSQDAAITAGIVAMARRLKLATIAEGVEDQAQLECLAGFDCDQVQGFLFSPAVAPEEFRSMVLAGAPARRRPPGTAASTSTEGARQ